MHNCVASSCLDAVLYDLIKAREGQLRALERTASLSGSRSAEPLAEPRMAMAGALRQSLVQEFAKSKGGGVSVGVGAPGVSATIARAESCRTLARAGKSADACSREGEQQPQGAVAEACAGTVVEVAEGAPMKGGGFGAPGSAESLHGVVTAATTRGVAGSRVAYERVAIDCTFEVHRCAGGERGGRYYT